MAEKNRKPLPTHPNSIKLTLLVLVLLVIFGVVTSIFLMEEPPSASSSEKPGTAPSQQAPPSKPSSIVPPPLRNLVHPAGGNQAQSPPEADSASGASQEVLRVKHAGSITKPAAHHKRVSVKNPGTFARNKNGKKLPHPSTSQARTNLIKNATESVKQFRGIAPELIKK